MAPLPARGRRFSAERTVRLGDATPAGRLRLDALARYLQDVAADDARDAGLGDDAVSWVVRRTTVAVGQLPRFGDRVRLTTFCGGRGGRWAERRTTVTGPAGAVVEAAALWVFVDSRSGRPAPLPGRFTAVWGEACGERKVSGRLRHPGPPPGASGRPWALRAADFDVLGHVNNAVYWAMVEDVIAEEAWAAVARAEVEFRAAVDSAGAVEVTTRPDAGGDLLVWASTPAGGVHASARLRPRPAA